MDDIEFGDADADDAFDAGDVDLVVDPVKAHDVAIAFSEAAKDTGAAIHALHALYGDELVVY